MLKYKYSVTLRGAAVSGTVNREELMRGSSLLLASSLVLLAVSVMAAQKESGVPHAKCASQQRSEKHGHMTYCFSKQLRSAQPILVIDQRVCVGRETSSGKCVVMGAMMSADAAVRSKDGSVTFVHYRPGGMGGLGFMSFVRSPPWRKIRAFDPKLCYSKNLDNFVVGMVTCPSGYVERTS